MAKIPATAHFIWFGARFPWSHIIALRSACERGGFDQVVLHHEEQLELPTPLRKLEDSGIFSRRLINPEKTLERCPHGASLLSIFRQLEKPEAKANLLRAALLWTEGGVYLDTDTLTVASFSDLRTENSAFCGKERIVYPSGTRETKNPLRRVAAELRKFVRQLLRDWPGGWRAFRAIEFAYPEAVNNAVLGAEAEHDFIGLLLKRMIEVPPERRLVRYALGTHLLQSTVAEYLKTNSSDDLTLYPSAYFYPLAPEISHHWFQPTTRPQVEQALLPETKTVHWYASVSTPKITPDYVRNHSDKQLYSALARPFVA